MFCFHAKSIFILIGGHMKIWLTKGLVRKFHALYLFKPDPGGIAVDPFTLDWSNHKFSFFPFSIISIVLHNVMVEAKGWRGIDFLSGLHNWIIITLVINHDILKQRNLYEQRSHNPNQLKITPSLKSSRENTLTRPRAKIDCHLSAKN